MYVYNRALSPSEIVALKHGASSNDTNTYDAADRMLTGAGLSYSYDNNGNQTSRGVDAFTWDSEDRLISGTVAGNTTTFVYNGDGLRSSRTKSGNTTTFAWDIASGLPQVVDDGAFKYVYGLGRIAEISTSGTWYYLSDALGSVMALTDSAGAIVNTYDYDVFGAVRSTTGTQPNEYKFAGEQVEHWDGGAPGSVGLPLDVVVSSTNLAGATVDNLDDDPDSPDGAWATASTAADTILRVGFPTPPGGLQAGPSLQEFRVQLRKNATGGNDPTYDLEMWESGGASPLATLASGVTLSSATGTVVSATWDANLLATADGSKVELRVVGHVSGGSPSSRRTVEVGAVEWNAGVNGLPGLDLVYLRARYYDPGTGRFLSRDPLYAYPPWTGQPYDYVAANPATLTDSSGMKCPLNPYDCVLDFLPRLPNNFTAQEFVHCATNWAICVAGLDISKQANKETIRLFGPEVPEGTPGDAFQHCYFSGLLTVELGSSLAKGITDRHEAYGGNDPMDRKMDQYNNRQGRLLGEKIRRAFGLGWQARLSGLCKSGTQNGRLVTSFDDCRIDPSRCPGGGGGGKTW